MADALDYDVVVVGCGGAGVSAALSAAETVLAGDRELTVAIVERTSEAERGGSTRYTGAFLRLQSDFTPAEGFEQEIMAFSEGKSDQRVVHRLGAEAPETLRWMEGHGVSFEALPTGFLTSSRPRLLPVGGGKAIVDTLARKAQQSGVEIVYGLTALRLDLDERGAVRGLLVRDNATGATAIVRCRAVILASGGFEGDERMLTQYLGEDAYHIKNISPGGERNKGEGIRMALEVGAKPGGRWDRFHAEPIDPRSRAEEPAMMIFPYCILVNREGRRFVDEGANTVDERYEEITRAVLRQPGGFVYCVADRKVFDIQGHERAIMSPEPPIEAGTIEELAEQLDLVDREAFVETVRAYSEAVQDGPFHAYRLDGKATANIAPPKSNWARPIDEPPFVAWPISCSIVFTFGGIAADEEARVLSQDDAPIPGLYAAGEITGLYYGKYPGATSVLRGLVYGRIAGRNAVRYVQGD